MDPMNTPPTLNQVSQGETPGSGSLSVIPAKRRRGRPRKDAGANSAPPGFQHEAHHPPQITNGAVVANSMVGQPVYGVIEAAFDEFYVINVRLANCHTNFRGAIFKQGQFVPVTPQNDVAPQMPTIRRSDNVRLPMVNQALPPSQAVSVQTTPTAVQTTPMAVQTAPMVVPPMAVQTAPMVVPPMAVQTAPMAVPPKRKREPPQTPKSTLSEYPRGTVVPVVLEPVHLQNGFNLKSPDSSRPCLIAFGDKGVQSTPPLLTLPPSHSVPPFHQVPPVSEPADKKQRKEDASETGNKKQLSTDADDSSGGSDTQTDSSKESLKPPQVVVKQESGVASKPVSTAQFFVNSCVPKAMFNFGTGKMTQLLQSVQENGKDKQAQGGESSQVEFRVG